MAVAWLLSVASSRQRNQSRDVVEKSHYNPAEKEYICKTLLLWNIDSYLYWFRVLTLIRTRENGEDKKSFYKVNYIELST